MKLPLVITHHYEAVVEWCTTHLYTNQPVLQRTHVAKASREEGNYKHLKLQFAVDRYSFEEKVYELSRLQVVALRDMLNEALIDWPEKEKEKEKL